MKNKKGFVLFMLLILTIIVSILVGSFFYNNSQSKIPGKGPILDFICRDTVNNAVNNANSQCNRRVNDAESKCNTRVSDADKKCTAGIKVFQDTILAMSGGSLPNPFTIYVDLPQYTASKNIAGEPNGKVSLPIYIEPGKPYIINWGDGTNDSNLTHVYSKLPGKYTISVLTLPNSVNAVSLNLNSAFSYMTYKDASNRDRTYITKIVTGNNNPSMNTFTSGGGMATATKPEDWGIEVIINNSCSGPVNDAVKAANLQCDTRVSSENTKCDNALGAIITKLSAADSENTKCQSDLGTMTRYYNNCQTSIPQINSITPSQGDIKGGYTISITGSNFLPNSIIFFGNIEIKNATITATNITFTAPQFKWALTNSNGQIYITIIKNNISSRTIYTFSSNNIILTFNSILPQSNFNLTGGEIATIESNIFSNTEYEGLPKYINFIFNNQNKKQIPIAYNQITMPVFFSGVNYPGGYPGGYDEITSLPVKNNYAIVYISIEIHGREYISKPKIITYTDPVILLMPTENSVTPNSFDFKIQGNNLYNNYPGMPNPIIFVAKTLNDLNSDKIIPIDAAFIKSVSDNEIIIKGLPIDQYIANNKFYVKVRFENVISNSREGEYSPPSIDSPWS